MNKLLFYLSLVLLLSSCQSIFWPEPIHTEMRVSLYNDLDYPILVESNFPCIRDPHLSSTVLFKNAQEIIEPDSTAKIAHCVFVAKSFGSDKNILDYILEYYPEASYSVFEYKYGERGDILVSIPFDSYFNAPMEWIKFGSTYYVDFTRTSSNLVQLLE